MTSAHDPLSLSFDSIDIDRARAPSAAADLGEAGHFLVDDAGGRFQIDREMGVISLRDEATLERERFSVHAVCVRVVERSGEQYELELKLRVTGMVPHVVGAEEALFEVPHDDEPVEQATPIAAPVPLPPTDRAPTHWTRYAAAHARAGKSALERTRRAFISAEWPAFAPTLANSALALDEAPPPVGLSSDWSL